MIITAATVLAVIAACSKTSIQDHQQEDTAELELDVRTGFSSKAMITSGTLDNGSEVGVYLLGQDGDLYDGIQYRNIRYTARNSSSTQSWNPDTKIMLSASKASLYSYYPYSHSVTSIKSIPVSATSTTQTDVMFGSPVDGLYNHSPLASIILNHALSVIQISLARGTYSGEGKVTAISVAGNGMARKGILDATTGNLSSFDEENMEIAPAITPFTLSSSSECNIIVIPNGRNERIGIDITIDGEPFHLDTESLTLRQGSIAAYNITVNNGGAKISGMTINEWGYSLEGNPTIENNYKISMTGDLNGISFDNKVNPDGSVQIIAVPYLSEDAEINPVEITGNAKLTQEVHNKNGVRIVTLTDIKSDISVIFHGYCLWVTATYDITDTASPASIYYSPAGRPNYPVRMQVDGEEKTPTSTYLFTSTGEHKVRYVFKDMTNIGYSFFNDITSLTSIKIPEGVKSLGHSVFFGSRRLASVTLPTSLTEIGYDCFRDAMSLESISLPEKALNLGTALFRGCSSLVIVNLPSGLSKIPDTMFRECSSLSELSLKEGISTIGSSAFIYSGIQSIDLPSTLTYLDSDVFSNCYQLSSIVCRASTPPKLYAYSDVFSGVMTGGVIYVPSGSESAYQSQWLQGQLLNRNWTLSTIQ